MRGVCSFVLLSITVLVVSAERPALHPRSIGNGRIVFTSDRDGDYDIWTMRSDGSRLRKLTHNRVEDRCPSWSPSGRWIAFTQRHVHPPDLFVMRSDGTRVHRVARLRGSESCPTWSPDGKRLVFVLLDALQPTRHAVFSIGVNGRGLRRLTQLNEAWEITSWSRTGRIAFESTYATEGGANIWTMRPDGSDRRRLTNATTEWNRHPRWSRDGRRLVFTNDREGDQDLYVMTADGSGVTRVTDDGVEDWNPGWSPDGRKLVFARSVANRQLEIFTANVDGSALRRLTHWRRVDSEPDWAPAR